MKPLLLVKEICLPPWYGRDKRCLEVMILVLDQRVGPPRKILSRKSTLLTELKYKTFIQLPFHLRLRVENLSQIALESWANSFQGYIPAYKLGTTINSSLYHNTIIILLNVCFLGNYSFVWLDIYEVKWPI